MLQQNDLMTLTANKVLLQVKKQHSRKHEETCLKDVLVSYRLEAGVSISLTDGDKQQGVLRLKAYSPCMMQLEKTMQEDI